MRSLSRGILSAAMIALAGLCLAPARAQDDDQTIVVGYTPPTYHLSVIVPKTNGGGSDALGVNNNGEVCGYEEGLTDPNYNAYVYSNGTVRPLGISAEALALNNTGVVVGFASDGQTGVEAFRLFDHLAQPLGFLPTGTFSIAQSISGNDQIAGAAQINDASFGSEEHPVLFQNSGPVDLVSGDTDVTSGATLGINNNGEAVGYISRVSANFALHAFACEGGFTEDLGALGGDEAMAVGVNDSGEIAGTVIYNATGINKVFVIRANGQLQILGRPAGVHQAEASAINKNGDIVGITSDPRDKFGGFLYSHNKFYDLQNQLDSSGTGFTIGFQRSLSDLGQIVGSSMYGKDFDLTLLTPDNTALSPTITQLAPQSAAALTTFGLTVTGTGFTRNSTVDWNNTPLPTKYVSATKLTATVSKEANGETLNGTNGEMANIVVVNPGGASSPAVFTVNVPTPVLTAITPQTTTAGHGSIQLTVIGTGFVAGDTIDFGGTMLATNYVSPTRLTALVKANLLTSAGMVSISVTGAGATSAPITLTIN